MTSNSQPRSRRILARVRRTIDEIEYAQRRITELNTGVPLRQRADRSGIARTAAELEALYTHDDPRLVQH